MLKNIHREIKDGRSRDKIKAILMLSDGHSQQEVSRVLLLDEDTVRSWKQKYENSKYFTDWLATEYEGYKGKLTIEQERSVSAYVAENTITDSKKVQSFLVSQFNKEYTHNGVISLLHRLGFSYKKTTLIPSKFDAEKQAEFKKTYETLEKNLKDDETILFMDGVHPQHNTTCTNAWIKTGETKTIKSNTGRSRVNINGAYNPANQDIIIHERETINAETIIESLKKIEQFYGDKKRIYIVVDNAKYYRNKDVTAYLKGARIELMFLPPYSPNLNLIERLWKYMRKKIINNEYYESFKEFKKVLFGFFEDCKDDRVAIKQFIGAKLHLLSPA